MTRKNYTTILATATLSAVLFLGSPVQAQSASAEESPLSSLIQTIASAFQLDAGKVETVVENWHQQHRTERQVKMEQRRDDYLSKLVTEGKLTGAQKQAVIAKMDELREKYTPEGMQGKTREERRTTREARRTEFESWAQSQGIDPSLLHPGKSGTGRGNRW